MICYLVDHRNLFVFKLPPTSNQSLTQSVFHKVLKVAKRPTYRISDSKTINPLNTSPGDL